LRKRIKHPHELSLKEFGELINGEFFATITEKTDGMAFQIGKVNGRVYTRTSNSPMVYETGMYEMTHRISRTLRNEEIEPWFSKELDKIHDQFTKTIGRDLEDGQQVTGELFWHPFGTKSKCGEYIRFITIPYSLEAIPGNTFVVHSRLSDIIPDSNFYFYVDTDSLVKSIVFDTETLKEMIKIIDKDLLVTRKKALANEKLVMENHFNDLLIMFESRLKSEIKRLELQPKWGPFTEGYVLHPANGPRIKLVTDYFKTKRAMEAFNGW